jgi:hypothetical protein
VGASGQMCAIPRAKTHVCKHVHSVCRQLAGGERVSVCADMFRSPDGMAPTQSIQPRHIMHAQPPMPPTASRCSFLHLACALVAAPVHLLFSFAWQRYHVRGSGGCTHCVKSPLQMMHTYCDLFAAGRKKKVLHRSTPMRSSSDRTTSNWLKPPLHIATDTYIPRHRHCRLVPHLFITSRCSLRRQKARRERPSILCSRCSRAWKLLWCESSLVAVLLLRCCVVGLLLRCCVVGLLLRCCVVGLLLRCCVVGLLLRCCVVGLLLLNFFYIFPFSPTFVWLPF